MCVCVCNSSEKSILLPRLPLDSSFTNSLFSYFLSTNTHTDTHTRLPACLLRFSGFSLCVLLTLLRLSRSLKSPVHNNTLLRCFISDRALKFVSFSNKTFRYFRWLAQLSFIRQTQRISHNKNNNN